MATTGYTRYSVDRLGRTFASDSMSKTSYNSPRVNGKIRLTPLPFTYRKDRVESHWIYESGVGIPPAVEDPNSGGSLPADFSWSALENEAYAKFQGKLRKGSASLGVTAASWRQSRDMIVNRTNKFRKTLDSSIARLEGNFGALQRLRKEREPLAGQILETEFGWIPLCQDLKAALTTVCDAVPDEWMTSRASCVVYEYQSSSSVRLAWDGKCKLTYNAKVAIENPNLWLLNRLGLINPGVVAWDLVPWSFVVNMFVNVNTMISSITDEVGLSISGQNITRSSHLGRETLRTSPWLDRTFTRVNKRAKNREFGSSLQPSLTVKLPNLDWNLAVIASALVVQRIQKLNRLIRLV